MKDNNGSEVPVRPTSQMSAKKSFRVDNTEGRINNRLMKVLAISGSARASSTNTAMLRAVGSVAPSDIEVVVYDGVGRMPVFSPDLEGGQLPDEVRQFIGLIAQSDGVIISSPEYVRSFPGGLKNAIDWLVSGEEIVGKPVALMHASHRGDDMLTSIRTVLGTVTGQFAEDIFLRIPLMKMTPEEISRRFEAPEAQAEVRAFLRSFQRFCERATVPA